jgi:hypothetical protein
LVPGTATPQREDVEGAGCGEGRLGSSTMGSGIDFEPGKYRGTGDADAAAGEAGRGSTIGPPMAFEPGKYRGSAAEAGAPAAGGSARGSGTAVALHPPPARNIRAPTIPRETVSEATRARRSCVPRRRVVSSFISIWWMTYPARRPALGAASISRLPFPDPA